MSKRKTGGLPRDTLFRRTEDKTEPEQKPDETVEEAAAETPEEPAAGRTRSAVAVDPGDQSEQTPAGRARQLQVTPSRSNQRDNEPADPESHDSDSKKKTTELPRQTYYVPAELHKQLRLIALERENNVSDLVVEGIIYVVKKYNK